MQKLFSNEYVAEFLKILNVLFRLEGAVSFAALS